jgi:3-oxoadipate enol-lactonase
LERCKAKTKITSESRRRFLTAAGSSLLLSACAVPDTSVPPRSGFVATPGQGRLYYEVAGSGTPVVLLHGFSFDMRFWDVQFAALSLSHRAVRYDLRGFGKSAVPSPGKAYSHVEDLRALLAQLDIAKAHLLGSSMGARVALDFALTHPQHCASLALISPIIGGWQWSPDWLRSYAPVVRAAQRGDVAAAKTAWLANPIFNTVRGNSTVFGNLRQMIADYGGWHFTHADPAKEPIASANSQLNRLGVPALAVIGEQDHADFREMSEALHLNGGATRLALPGVGHFPGQETPQRVNEALLNFFRPSA